MRTTIFAALTALPLLAGPALSQEDPSQSSRTTSRYQDQIISIEFRGGTLSTYVAAIRDAGEDVNILMPSDAMSVDVPALELRNVSVPSALEAITDIVDDRWSVDIRSHRSKGGSPVYSVRVKERGQNPAAVQMGMAPQRMVRVFSLRGLTDLLPGYTPDPGLTVKPETILTAIETGLEIANEKQKAVIRYHPDSGLLFVQGSHSQTSIVQNVLGSMAEDLDERRSATRRSTDAKRSPETGPARPTGSRTK